MKPSPARRSIGLVAGSLIAILVTCVIAPQVAEAGCGHELASGALTRGIATLASLDVLPSLGDLSGDWPPTHDRRVPCSGPSCSRKSQNLDATAFPKLIIADRWLCLSIEPAALPDPGSRRFEHEPRVRSRLCPCLVDRPPRSPFA